MVVYFKKSEIRFFLIIVEGNYFGIYISIKEVFHLIKNCWDFSIIVIRVLLIKRLEIKSLLIIVKYNYFKEYIFIKKSFKILDSKKKVNLIIEFSRSMNLFPYLIFRMFSTIIK